MCTQSVAIGKWNRNWASCSAQNSFRIIRRLRNRLRSTLLHSLDEFFIVEYTRPKLDFRHLRRRIVRRCEQYALEGFGRRLRKEEAPFSRRRSSHHLFAFTNRVQRLHHPERVLLFLRRRSVGYMDDFISVHSSVKVENTIHLRPTSM
jgi:hypothetical protein